MNILLTSVGRRTYMVKYFQQVVKSGCLVHVANSVPTYAMEIADVSICTPLIHDETYVDYLINYCIKNNIKAIIPLFDIDLPILANSKTKFEAHDIQVVVSDYEITQICNDKWKTYNFLNLNNIPTPRTFISIKDCLAALNSKIIDFPLIIKPRWGMGSIGIYQAENLSELDVLYKKTKKDIMNTYLKYESSIDLESSVIIQEKLQGIEYGLDVFNDLKGHFLTCIPKKKISMRAGETDSAIIIDDMKLFELGNYISLKLKHVANLDIDCFLVNGIYYVLEMNCRFGGQYPFSHLAGVNLPKVIMSMLNGENIETKFLKPILGTIGVKDIEPKVLINRMGGIH